MEETVRRYATLGLVLAVVLAGCAVGPFGDGAQDRPAPVHLGNEADDSYRFEVSVATVGPNLTVRRESGETRSVALTGALFGVESTAEDPIAAVELPDTAEPYGTYTLGPGESRDLSIGGLRQDETLLVLVVDADDGTVQSVWGFHCRPSEFRDVEVTVRGEYDTDWSSSCA